MILRPGSAAWLLRHDLRLDWRRRTERRGIGRLVAIVVTAVPVFLSVVLGHSLGLLVARSKTAITPMTSAVAALGLVGMSSLMLSVAIAMTVEALYERGDLDLLFGSPLPPTRIVFGRALAIAFTGFSPFGFFLAGPIVGIAWVAGPGWLLSLIVLFCLAMGATGCSLVLALGLLRLLGARRTRWIAQGAAAAIGALIFLLGQSFNIVAPGDAMSLWTRALHWLSAPGAAPASFLSWPLRALMGEPLPFLTISGLGVLAFAAGVGWSGPRFAAGLASAAGVGAGGARRTAASHFRPGVFSALYRKEVRLLVRDPTLIPQVLLRLVYLVPIAALTARYAGGPEAGMLAGALLAMVLMANQLTGSLACMTISGEEAPVLLASSPADPRVFAVGKLLASATPAAVVLAPAILVLLWRAPRAGAIALASCLATLVSAALVNLVWQRPAPRAELRRRRNVSWFVTLIELAQGLLIASAAAMAVSGWVAAWVPAVLAAFTLALLVRSAARSAGLVEPNVADRTVGHRARRERPARRRALL